MSKAIPTGRDGLRVQGFKGPRGQVKWLRVKEVVEVERVKDIGNVEGMLKAMTKSLENK